MKFRNACVEYGRKAAVVGGSAALSLAVTAQSALAALPTDVDTAISASQTDTLAMIAKGYAYLGAIGGGLVLLGMFYRILRKPAR